MNKKTILPKQQSLPHRQKIVVFTGAGISKESGMETFRDLDGLWKRYDPAQIATPEGFAADTEFVLNFYNEMRKMLIDIEPNHAHKIVAALEEWHDVTVITQNIDDLHERAGSSHVIHVHGELTKVTSSYDYLNPRYIQPYPLDKAIKVGDKALDGSQLRPYIVWFGESLPELGACVQRMQQADYLLIIGTSLTVMPAAGLINYAPFNIPKFCIDPNKLMLPSNIEHIKEPATRGIDIFIKRLQALQQK